MREFVKPFPNLNINDYFHLFDITERFKCTSCKKFRKFYCYKCSIPHPETKIPKIDLPFKLDIIKHKKEVDGKSTSSYAKMVCGDYVNIYEYPNIPDYENQEDVVLLFVSPNAVDMRSLFKGCKKLKIKENYGLEKGYLIGTLLMKNLKEIVDEGQQEELESMQEEKIYTLENLPIKKAVMIDSTWKQVRSIYQDKRIQSLNTVIIQNRITKFWRKQKGAPEWYLSTIEAIHQLFLEFHVNAWGISKSYYENCLKDYQFISTDWIPKEKIISLNDEGSSSEKSKELNTPYSGQYDNLLFFFSFTYTLIHSLENPNQCLSFND